MNRRWYTAEMFLDTSYPIPPVSPAKATTSFSDGDDLIMM